MGIASSDKQRFKPGSVNSTLTTHKQVREKIKKLKQDYNNMKDPNSRSRSDQRTSKWFDRLNSLLGHRPALLGMAERKDSITVLLEEATGEMVLVLSNNLKVNCIKEPYAAR